MFAKKRRNLLAIPLLLAALALLAVLFASAPAAEAQSAGLEPANVQVTPGDGTLTVTWEVSPREGFADDEIKHALRWSQVSGVWANPTDPQAGGPEDGISVEGGVTGYTITGLENGVATGVFVRSFTGSSLSERASGSSLWVREKGDHTTPGQPVPQEQTPPDRQAQPQQQAAGIVVGSGCTLADAITAANSDSATGGCPAGSGGDTISLSGNVTLTANLPNITSSITFEGNGYTIDGAGSYRPFRFDVGGPTVVLNDMTVTNARSQSGASAGGALDISPSSGGTVTVTLNDVTVRNSRSWHGGIQGDGGAIYCAWATLTINNSKVHDNHGNEGGGILVGSVCTATINQSAIYNNTSRLSGGGILAAHHLNMNNSTVHGNNSGSNSRGGGIHLTTTATGRLKHVTVTGNAASGSFSNGGGGIASRGNATLHLDNSIVHGNTLGDCSTQRTLATNSNNIIGATSNCGAGTGGSSADPLLASSTSGSPPYFALRQDSPAVDAAACLTGLDTDQRGTARPYGDACDIGAYEVEYASLALTSGGSALALTPAFAPSTTGYTATVAHDATSAAVAPTWSSGQVRVSAVSSSPDGATQYSSGSVATSGGSATLGLAPQGATLVVVTVNDNAEYRFTVNRGLAPPSRPTGLIFAGDDRGQTIVTWSPPPASEMVTGYDVEYKGASAPDRPAPGRPDRDAANYENAVLVHLSDNPSAFLGGWVDAIHGGQGTAAHLNLPEGYAFDVRVRATNATGASPWSAAVRGAPSGQTAGAVWEATLTVGSFGQLRGCFASISQCSTALDDNSFALVGVDYIVSVVSLGSGDLLVTFDRAVPESFDQLRLAVGDSAPLFLADAAKSNSDKTLSWSNPGLTWTAGDTVSLKLEDLNRVAPYAPAGFAVADGFLGTLTASWDMAHGVRSYQLEYRASTRGGSVVLNLAAEDASPYSIAGLDNYVRYNVRARALGPGGYSPWTDWEGATPTDPAARFLWSTEWKTGLSFLYYGQSYTIESLSLQSGTLSLTLDKDVPEGLRKGGYLALGPGRNDKPPEVLRLPGQSDFDANPKVLKWTGVKLSSPMSLTLYAYERPDPKFKLLVGRDQEDVAQIRIAEGSRQSVWVIVSERLTAPTSVLVTLTGDGPCCDFEVNRAHHVVGDTVFMSIPFRAFGQTETEQGQEFLITASSDAEAEGEETILVRASIAPEDPDRVYSDELKVRIPANVGKPDVSVSGSGSSLTAAWSAPAQGDGPEVTGYDVQYKKRSDTAWRSAGSVGAAGSQIWSATLTVKKPGNIIWGCDNNNIPTCTAHLTGTSFTYAGVDYEVTGVHNERVLVLGALVTSSTLYLDKDIPEAMKTAGILHLGSTQLHFANASYRPTAPNAAVWSVSGNTLGNTEDQVAVRLTVLQSRITGLDATVPYDVRVRATHAVGEGAWVTATLVRQAGQAPQPRVMTRHQRLDVSWRAPLSDGGGAITGYEVQYQYRDDMNNNVITSDNVVIDGMTAVITGLENGRRYNVRVRAVNAFGPGLWSPWREAYPGVAAGDSIWSATLTIKDIGGTNQKYGCQTASSAAANKCSTATTLSDNTFTAGGVDYTVAEITRGTFPVGVQSVGGLTFAVTPPSTFAETSVFYDYLLYVDGVRYDFRETPGDEVIWNANLGWRSGDVVQLRLVPRPPDRPSSIAVWPGHDEIIVTWKRPLGPRVNQKLESLRGNKDEGHSPITHYEVRHRERGTAGDAWSILTSPAGRHSLRIVGLTANTEQIVQVRAVSAAGHGPWSFVHNATTLASNPISLVFDRVTLTEGGPEATVTVTIPASWTQSGRAILGIGFGGSEEPRAEPGDYLVSNFPNVFEQGERTKSFTVSAVADGLLEPDDEYFALSISGGPAGSDDSFWAEPLFFTIAGPSDFIGELTVDVSENGRVQGCDNVVGDPEPCTAQLSPDSFSYKGVSYTITRFYNSPSARIVLVQFGPAPPRSFRDEYTMYVDGVAHDLATISWSAANNQVNYGTDGSTWSAGQKVSLRLRPKASGALPQSGVQQSPGGQSSPGQEGQQGAAPEPGQLEPYNVQVTPGDGTLTVTWEIAPRDGFDNSEIRHALRWSQVSGVWANPPDPDGPGRNDGITVEGGVTSFTITGLTNDVATGVFVRSFTGHSLSERSEHSSEWVRVKGDHTTPRAGQSQPQEQTPPQQEDSQQQQTTPKTFSVTPTASAAEGASATLTVTLSETAPSGGVELTVTAGYTGSAGSDDVGSIASPVTVPGGSDTLAIAVPTAHDAVDEDDETFTVTIAAAAQDWEKAGDGQDVAAVTIIDDDTAGVTVTPTSLSLAEDGSASYAVVLDSQPAGEVYVTPESADTGAVFDPFPLVFTEDNWDTPQTVTLNGDPDDDRDDESMTISHEVVSPEDARYNAIAAASVSVSVTDTTPAPAQEDQQQAPAESGPPVAGQLEPYNIQVTPGDGTLTVTWSVAPRDGFEDHEIRHALRWSQVSGVWANPTDPLAIGANDGVTVEGGVYSYTITGLTNGVATGVFVRSYTGPNHTEGADASSEWVRIKDDRTTPRAD